MKEDPTKWAAGIVTLIEALLLAFVGSGMLVMEDAQVQLWVNVATALFVVVTPLIGMLWVRKQSTPMVAPKDEDGSPLLRTDGTMPTAQMRHEMK